MKSQSELTFKHNIGLGRHGWLRLTPAYSVKLVSQLLDKHPIPHYILDPFCGTGTTALACRERGIACDTIDINPFLIWFTRVKTATYSAEQIALAGRLLPAVLDVERHTEDGLFIPPIRDIQKWWSASVIQTLARLYQGIGQISESAVRDLYLVAFCQTLIESSNAAFNHQSMSFKQPPPQPSLFDLGESGMLLAGFARALNQVRSNCQVPLSGRVQVIQADSRNIPPPPDGLYDCVVTSPPYPNRMSYVRELRPYMYWLGYLSEARQAGELDWQAIGGTWGIATSRVGKWLPPDNKLALNGFAAMIGQIEQRSQTLANYVHKYFVDIHAHLQSLIPHLAAGARLHYIVGNSKFYDVVVPVERFYAELFSTVGLQAVNITPIRKRNSKKELFEYLVEAVKA